jgi:mono/diheme cytochrome c family protein
MKWFFAFVAAIGIGVVIFFTIMFIGPRMRVQQHIRTFQKSMPLPPEGIVPVEPDRYAVPPQAQAASLKNPLQDNQANRDRGRTYYTYYCIFCHGENGQGDGPVGYSYMPSPTDLHAPKVLKMSDGELLRAMLLGVGHEPVLSRVVFPEHRWYLVGYVRTLGKEPRAPAENQGRQVLIRGPETR